MVDPLLVSLGVRVVGELLRSGIELDQIVGGLLEDGSISPERADAAALVATPAPHGATIPLTLQGSCRPSNPVVAGSNPAGRTTPSGAIPSGVAALCIGHV